MLTDESKRFKRLRLHLKLSQQELSKALNIDQAKISRIESGSSTIPLSIVKTLHLTYKLSYSWFYHGTGTMFEATPERPTITTDLKNILTELDQLRTKVEKQDLIINKLAKDLYDRDSKHASRPKDKKR